MNEDKEQMAEETAHALPKPKRVRKPKLKVMTLVEAPKVEEIPSVWGTGPGQIDPAGHPLSSNPDAWIPKTPIPPAQPVEKPKTISIGAEFKSYTINDQLAKWLGVGHWDVVNMETFKASLRRREDKPNP